MGASQSLSNDEGTHRTLTDRAYTLLRDDIIHGAFAPGVKLRIEHLKQRYEIGATPLREALSRLSENGFVTVEGQRGFRVAPISLQDLEEVTELRVLLENQALRKSFERGNDDWEAGVVAAFHQLAKVETAEDPDLQEWELRNARFHEALLAACASQWLRRFHEILYDQHKRYRNISRIDRSVPRDVHGEHQAIRDAAIARDVERACAANEAHIRRTAEVVARLMAAQAAEGR